MAHGVERVTFGSVLAVSEFRAMWAAELLSIAGDQLARVALSILVFQRTDSAFLTGLTYALTFVPALAGGIALGSFVYKPWPTSGAASAIQTQPVSASIALLHALRPSIASV